MSDFDQFDVMGESFFEGEGTFEGDSGKFDEEDADMFSMFEESAKVLINDTAGVISVADDVKLPETFAAPKDTSGSERNDNLVEAAVVPLGAKRPREQNVSVVQDFTMLHSDLTFKQLFKTPESIILATPIVVNCIGLVYLGCGVDLRALACSVRNVEYNCSRAPRAVLRLVEPHCSAIIRSNGVVTIVGSGSVQATKTAAELTARIIRCALGLTDLLAIKFRLRTLMVRFDLQRPIRIGNLAAENPGCASYEPETFCACILRLTGTLLSDGSTFDAEPQEATLSQTHEAVSSQPFLSEGNQSEVDDFFASDDLDVFQPVTQKNENHVAPIVKQAQALSAIRWTISANVFVSGKVTMIGAKSVDEVVAAYTKLLKLVMPHMKI